MAKPKSKTRNPMMSMSAVMNAKGMGSKYKKPPSLSKRKVSSIPKGFKRDKTLKSGGTDISKLVASLLKAKRRG